ncbi:MAG: hypothetical protein ABIM74_01460 [candidate division WOR-3 bacterium]
MRQMLKGTSFRLLMDFVREVIGEGALDELLETLSPEAKKTFTGEIEPGAWYPLDHFDELEKAIVDRFFGGDITYARKIARFTMERAYADIYRLAFILMKTPKDAIRAIEQLWSLYNTPGIIKIEIGEGWARGRLSEIYSINDIHKEHLCGWGERLLEKVGAKNPHLSWEQDGDDVIFHFSWEEDAAQNR